jgi:hypothetical protein
MAKILAAILLVFASLAHADELIFDTFSLHSSRTYTDTVTTTEFAPSGLKLGTKTTTVSNAYNNTNPGVGYKFDDGWMIGAYKNSCSVRTYYVAKGLRSMGRLEFVTEVGKHL